MQTAIHPCYTNPSNRIQLWAEDTHQWWWLGDYCVDEWGQHWVVAINHRWSLICVFVIIVWMYQHMLCTRFIINTVATTTNSNIWLYTISSDATTNLWYCLVAGEWCCCLLLVFITSHEITPVLPSTILNTKQCYVVWVYSLFAVNSSV